MPPFPSQPTAYRGQENVTDFAGAQDLYEDVKPPVKMQKLDKLEGPSLRTVVVSWGSGMKPKSLFAGLAVLVMFLLLLIPSWNAVGLLQDPVFMYMAGSELSGWLLVCCIFLFVISYITIQIFIDRIRPEQQTEQTMLMVSGIFLSTLGVMLILFGGPLMRQATMASSEFMVNCRSGKMTQSLYIAQKELSSLRAMPSCTKLASVEDCIAFQAFPKMKEAMVLKAMENQYQCSGICQGRNQAGEQIYPPTLFSKANYHVSCDGMASRRMLDFNAGVSSQMVAEGCMLVGTAIVISFCQLFVFCLSRGRSKEATSEKSYGATL